MNATIENQKDLGLIYDCRIVELENNKKEVVITMTCTPPSLAVVPEYVATPSHLLDPASGSPHR